MRVTVSGHTVHVKLELTFSHTGQPSEIVLTAGIRPATKDDIAHHADRKNVHPRAYSDAGYFRKNYFACTL